MRHLCHLRGFVVFLGVVWLATMLPACAAAQADSGVSLGDLARSLRQSKNPSEPAAPNVIDNDNLSQVIDDVEHFRRTAQPMFSFDGKGRNFQMSSPDGTCSLSFNANATALVSSPYVSQDLPQSELAKLDGPANIHGDTLEVSVYNASPWNLREITVGLTIVRTDTSAASDETAKLPPAAIGEMFPTERRPDMTLLLHLKGSTAPFATTVYREKLDASLLGVNLDQGQEWHWAIIEAKGIPPATLANASKY
jgi:hypothetical protein